MPERFVPRSAMAGIEPPSRPRPQARLDPPRHGVSDGRDSARGQAAPARPCARTRACRPAPTAAHRSDVRACGLSRRPQSLRDAGRSGSNADHKTDWLAIAVLYARPFTQNEVGRLSSTSFEAFDSEELDAVHRLLVSARHNTFAHTGVHPALSAVVLPPGAWSERGSTTVGEVPFARPVVVQGRGLDAALLLGVPEPLRRSVSKCGPGAREL